MSPASARRRGFDAAGIYEFDRSSRPRTSQRVRGLGIGVVDHITLTDGLRRVSRKGSRSRIGGSTTMVDVTPRRLFKLHGLDSRGNSLLGAAWMRLRASMAFQSEADLSSTTCPNGYKLTLVSVKEVWDGFES